MKEYHKINTVFKRDENNKHKTLLEGQWSLPEFDYLANNEWVYTEKVDGMCIRVMIDNQEVRFGGKTDNAQIPSSLVNRLHDIFSPQKSLLLEMFPDGACLYMEGYGNKIQSGGKYRSDQSVVLFDVKIGHWWLKRDSIEDIAQKLHLEVVPVIGSGNLFQMVDITRKGFNSHWGEFIAEGIVARPSIELLSRSGSRIITKIKHKDFYC